MSKPKWKVSLPMLNMHSEYSCSHHRKHCSSPYCHKPHSPSNCKRLGTWISNSRVHKAVLQSLPLCRYIHLEIHDDYVEVIHSSTIPENR